MTGTASRSAQQGSVATVVAVVAVLAVLCSGCSKDSSDISDIAGAGDTDTDADSGTDTDTDTVTDTDPVVCTSECWEGDFEIFGAEDVATLAPYACVNGKLRVSGTSLTTLELPCLESVNGDLEISSNAALTSLEGLSGLTSVGGSLGIYNNAVLYQCQACALLYQLVDFTGTFDFHDNHPDDCNDDCAW